MKIPWPILLGCLFLSACAHTQPHHALVNHFISEAITENDRIDGKAVMVESWLKSH